MSKLKSIVPANVLPFSAACSILVLQLLVLPVVVRAQELESKELVAGARIRVLLPSGTELAKGTLVRATADSLWVVQNARYAPYAIARSDIDHVEQKVGTNSRAGRGLAGGFIGLLGWWGVGSLIVRLQDPQTEASGFGAAVVVGFGGPLVGLPLGVIIGATTAGERWQSATMPLRVGSASTTTRPMRVGLSLTF